MSDNTASRVSPARLRWLCRRGMKELDVLLERFVAAELERLTPAERELLYQLLVQEDPDLYLLLLGRATPEDPGLAGMAERIRRYRAPA